MFSPHLALKTDYINQVLQKALLNVVVKQANDLLTVQQFVNKLSLNSEEVCFGLVCNEATEIYCSIFVAA